MSMNHRWIGGISALFGAWVFVSAFVFGMAGAHFWNDIVVGAAIFVLAGYSAGRATANAWSSGLAALLGLWMIVTPFVYAGVGTAATWSGVISGIVVAVLSGYNAYRASESAGGTAPASTDV